MDDNSSKFFIDLFAGCGGLSLGLEQAGFKPVLVSELNKSAAETYKSNRSEENIIYIPDVKNITEEKVKKFKNIDLVCGGPPCQGYSAIGIRRTHKAEKKTMPKNRLYKQMIRIIGLVEPKIFLFENVRGILTGRWTSGGKKGEIFRSVFKDFHDKLGENYHVRWELIKSSSYGIPQNRPRLFMVGLQKSLNFCKKREKKLSGSSEIILEDMKKDDSPLKKGYGVDDEFFPKKCDEKAPGPKELLDDLVDPDYEKHGYVNKKYLKKTFISAKQKEMRKRKNTTKDEDYMKDGEELTEQVYSKHNPLIKEKFQYMIENNKIHPDHKTKKFSQKKLPAEWGGKPPTITVTSLPDDYVHYSQPRILTVREWARLQTFPDWYEFEGNRTTGGNRRSGTPQSTADQIETPKYTQIGNAVPVELARQIGEHFKTLLD